MKPRARSDGLVVRHLPGELIVYDLERHAAHCLNETAATIFRHADGRRTRSRAVVRSALSQQAAAECGPGNPLRQLSAVCRGLSHECPVA